jgi:hypothetical protein
MPRSGRLSGRGLNQDELLDLIALLRTNTLALTAALDADDGVASTTYTSTFTFDLPSRFADGYVRDQGTLIETLETFTTKWNAMLAIADADATITDTNYAATCGIAVTLNVRASSSVLDAGMYEGSLVKWLDTTIDQFNAALAKFDADLGDTTYATTYGITAASYIDDTGARLKVS